MYTVKEIFYSVQGEGLNAGRAAVFCRFAGCNLWTGRESDRGAASCSFCDTDFLGVGPDGGRYATADALADAVAAYWPTAAPRVPSSKPFVVCTGGEPSLQLDSAAIIALKSKGFEIAIETNGTRSLPPGIDHICVSPKGSNTLAVHEGHELKLVYPQSESAAQPEMFDQLRFQHFFLQPMDGPHIESNMRRAVAYCLSHPWWRLSIQTHKAIGVR